MEERPAGLYPSLPELQCVVSSGFAHPRKRRANEATAPAKSALQYERKRLMRNIEDNVYTGEPRPEHDSAWRRLIERQLSTLGQVKTFD